MKRVFITAAIAIVLALASSAAAQPFYGDPYDGARAAQWRYGARNVFAYAFAPPIAPLPPQPLGWVFGRYTTCIDPPMCASIVVAVGADGLNVRAVPNGPVIAALVNGVPIVPLDRSGDWLLVSVPCLLMPTWTWSWTAGVPLSVCL